jgi:formylglycine-generating enzyme
MMRRLLLLSGFLIAACSGPGTEETKSATSQSSHPVCGLSDARIGEFVEIPEGSFEMGANAKYPEEAPARRVHVAAFSIQIHEVTNAQFARFVEATHYVTDAERSSASSDPAGGSAMFVLPDAKGASGVWTLQRSASWRTPSGAGTGIAGRMKEPVVHVSLNDARAYAAWAGGRLPTEEEWEYAATEGLSDPANPLSGAFDEDGKLIANTWQGIFPLKNEAADGFAGVAPVGCFPPSRNDLFDMIGNVWEWTATPYGAGTGTIKGGSYLCAENFCQRYRTVARQGQEIDFSSNHIGFRIVKDVSPS